MRFYERFLTAVVRHMPYFWRFGTVGLSGVFVNQGIFIIFLGIGFQPWFSSLVAVETSILSNFILNDLWVFKGLGRHGFLSRLGLFHVLRALGGAVNVLAVILLTSAGLSPELSNIVGIGMAVAVNYLTSVELVWRVG